jgi:hypothetical protein
MTFRQHAGCRQSEAPKVGSLNAKTHIPVKLDCTTVHSSQKLADIPAPGKVLIMKFGLERALAVIGHAQHWSRLHPLTIAQ